MVYWWKAIGRWSTNSSREILLNASKFNTNCCFSGWFPSSKARRRLVIHWIILYTDYFIPNLKVDATVSCNIYRASELLTIHDVKNHAFYQRPLSSIKCWTSFSKYRWWKKYSDGVNSQIVGEFQLVRLRTVDTF